MPAPPASDEARATCSPSWPPSLRESRCTAKETSRWSHSDDSSTRSAAWTGRRCQCSLCIDQTRPRRPRWPRTGTGSAPPCRWAAPRWSRGLPAQAKEVRSPRCRFHTCMAVFSCIVSYFMLRVAAHIQDPAVHQRVQRLHTAVHHLGRLGVLRHVDDGQTRLAQLSRRAARTQQFNSKAAQLLREGHDARLVGHGQQRAPDGDLISIGTLHLGQDVRSHRVESDIPRADFRRNLSGSQRRRNCETPAKPKMPSFAVAKGITPLRREIPSELLRPLGYPPHAARILWHFRPGRRATSGAWEERSGWRGKGRAHQAH
eukprot:scaffold1289_cov274-Pinguiococcus_pyrenoidosus.AAC.11